MAYPRLYHAVDDPDCRFPPPQDRIRKRILGNIIADCEEFSSVRPWKKIPERPDSPHPFHQLYISFYSAMQCTALIEQYSFAWLITRDKRWLAKARKWLRAATQWEINDRLEVHFYTANRYMHAFAVALDWLQDSLSRKEEQTIVDSLIPLMKRWWPVVRDNRNMAEGGHHTVVDNGHFGTAALKLLGRHPDAQEWVNAVVERFRSGVMPLGCGENGEAIDGPVLWAAENLWMFQFCDALRNVTGIDLYREFPNRVKAPLTWLRYHLAPCPGRPRGRHQKVTANILTGSIKDKFEEATPVIMRLAQEAGDQRLRESALGDPRLGRIYRFGIGVKNCKGECMYTAGPSAYLFYDPRFKPRPIKLPPPSRAFNSKCGKSVVLRSGWERESLVAVLTGFGGAASHTLADLHIQWSGNPMLKVICAEEASPTGAGNVSCVGGQNEFIALLGKLRRGVKEDVIVVDSPRIRHEYRLIRGKSPALLISSKRKKRGVKLLRENGMPFVRTDGVDYLQYERQRYFNPAAGELTMRVRLTRPLEKGRPQVLFHTGMDVPGANAGLSVNGFALGFFDGESLSFAVRSQRYLDVKVTVPCDAACFQPGEWRDITARWGGFNKAGDKPFIEIESQGHRQRCDDAALFGEMGKDTQGLASRKSPRTFFVYPNTHLAFGAPIQFRGIGVHCDIARITLTCTDRRPLEIDFSDGLQGETGSGPIQWKFNPADAFRLTSRGAVLKTNDKRMLVTALPPGSASFAKETVPFHPAGLAAASLKYFTSDAQAPADRLIVTATGDSLSLLFSDPRAPIPG